MDVDILMLVIPCVMIASRLRAKTLCAPAKDIKPANTNFLTIFKTSLPNCAPKNIRANPKMFQYFTHFRKSHCRPYINTYLGGDRKKSKDWVSASLNLSIGPTQTSSNSSWARVQFKNLDDHFATRFCDSQAIDFVTHKKALQKPWISQQSNDDNADFAYSSIRRTVLVYQYPIRHRCLWILSRNIFLHSFEKVIHGEDIRYIHHITALTTLLEALNSAMLQLILQLFPMC